jgi:hypothetical protein
MRRDAHDVTSNELDLYTWTQYIPPSVIHGFEQKYDLKVKVTYYSSNEEAIAGVEANPGKYDIVIPSDYAVQIMRDRDLLESIDPTTDLRNWGNIDASFHSPAFDPGSGLRGIDGRAHRPPLAGAGPRHQVASRSIRASACAITTGSWVATTTVAPCSRAASASSLPTTAAFT